MIIELGGVDGTGKSTQLERIKGNLEFYGYDVDVPPSSVKLSTLYPQDLEQRKQWYATASSCDIIRANADGIVRKFDIANSSSSDYVLLDRGYYNSISSSIARLTDTMPYDEAKGLVEHIYDEYMIDAIEDKHVIYYVPFHKLVGRLDDTVSDFVDYIKRFSESLDIEASADNVYKINSDRHIDMVTHESLESILYKEKKG